MWTKYLRQNPDTAARTIDGRAIVIRVEDSLLHELSETGTEIWELSKDGKLTLEEMAAQLATKFEVGSAQLRAEALAFVEDMVERRLLLASDQPMG